MDLGVRRREGYQDYEWWQYWLNLELECVLGLPCKVKGSKEFVELDLEMCSSVLGVLVLDLTSCEDLPAYPN